MKLDEAIQSRRSIRKFKEKRPDWRDIMEALDATRYAPMSGDIFSLKFIYIDNEKTISEIAKWSGQDFIAQAKCVVVFIRTPTKTKLSFKDRAELYLPQQAGAAIQNFLLKLEEKGLSTCWIGHFDNEKIKHLLKIPKDKEVEALFPIGYAKEKPSTRRARRDFYEMMFFNEWGNEQFGEVKSKRTLEV